MVLVINTSVSSQWQTDLEVLPNLIQTYQYVLVIHKPVVPPRTPHSRLNLNLTCSTPHDLHSRDRDQALSWSP